MHTVMYFKQRGCKGLFSKLNDLIQATAAKFSVARLKSAPGAHLLPKSNSFATVAANNKTIVYVVTKAYSGLSKKKKNLKNPSAFLFILKSVYL